MARFGIIGAWAPHCDRLPSPTNPTTIFAAGGREATTQMREDNWSAPAATGIVQDAAIVAPGQIRLRIAVSFARGGSLVVRSETEMDGQGRIRVSSSTVFSAAGSQAIVAYGRHLVPGPGFSAGDAMPWLTRCSLPEVS